MEKQCERCLEIKDISKFAKQKRKKEDYYDKVCRNCRNTNARNNNNKVRVFMDEIRTPCVICGEPRKHLIDFHHLNPKEKDFNISKYSISGATKFETKKIKILEEVSKCVTICSNCHRDFHYMEKTKGITFNNYKRDVSPLPDTQ